MAAKRALIAISGGVDSSVAALLARDAGYDCTAAMLMLFDDAEIAAAGFNDAEYGAGDSGGGVECGAGDGVREASFVRALDAGSVDDVSAGYANASDAEYARDVAHRLGISLEILDFRNDFENCVINPFVASYLSGATPNPCVACNSGIKFGQLIDYATINGFDLLVTGHYARIDRDSVSGRYILKKGIDPDKDQSYVLYKLTQRQLGFIKFPLGGMHKTAVRELAARHGFPNAKRRDSQDVCFIGGGSYADFIEKRVGKPLEDGPIVDDTGNNIGTHKNAVRYTIGQRKGLGLAWSEPLYVYAKSIAENKIFVGPESMLYKKSLIARDINFIPFHSIAGSLAVTAKTRYRQPEQEAVVRQTSDDEVHVEFLAPQRAIAAGQSVVFYDGEIVIGGGIIAL